VEHHVEVHALDAFPLFGGHVEELADHDQAGHEARRVEPAEPVQRGGDEFPVAVRGRQVDVGDGVNRRPERLEFGYLCAERRLDADHRVVAGCALEHQVVAAGGECPCERWAHVPGGHRDECDRTLVGHVTIVSGRRRAVRLDTRRRSVTFDPAPCDARGGARRLRRGGVRWCGRRSRCAGPIGRRAPSG
jgi:hypothetical protein